MNYPFPIIALLLGSSAFAMAGESKIKITNAVGQQEIVLSSSPTDFVTVKASGEIEARCANPADPSCTIGETSAPLDPSPGAATIRFLSASGVVLPSNEIDTNVEFILRVTPPSAADAASACVLTSVPAQLSTTGVSLATLALVAPQDHRLRIGTPGTVQFAVECLKSSAASSMAQLPLIVNQAVEPPEPTDNCLITKESLRGPGGEETQDYRLFQPAGFTPLNLDWSQVFPNQVYPDTLEYPYPVGSWSQTDITLPGTTRYLQSPTMTGRYISIPFTALNQTVGIQWITALPRSSIGYAPIRIAGNIMVTISNCRGDFRTRSEFATAPPDDPTAVSACRIIANSEAGIAYGPGAQCRTIAGQRYYMNIVFQDPGDGQLLPNRTTCANQFTGVCEAGFVRNL